MFNLWNTQLRFITQKSELLICQLNNSDFCGKNPSCLVSKIHELGLISRKNPSYYFFNWTTRIFTQSELSNFRNIQLRFLAQKSELSMFQINNSDFFYKSELFNWQINNSDFCVINPNCVFWRLNNPIKILFVYFEIRQLGFQTQKSEM